MGAAVQAAAFIWLARVTSPATVGVLGAVMSVSTAAAALSDFGLSTLISRAGSRSDHHIVAGALRLNRFTSLGLGSLIIVAGIVIDQPMPLRLAAVLLGLAIVLEKNTDAMLMVSLSEGRTGPWIRSVALRRGVQTAGLLVLSQRTEWESVLVFSISWAAAALVGQVHASAQSVTTKHDAKASIKETARVSAPFALNAAAAQSRVLDVLLVTLLSSAAQGGYYAAALRFVSPLLFVPTIVATLVVPGVAGMEVKDVKKHTRGMYGSAVIVLVPCAALAAASDTLVDALFGSDYRPAAACLAILLLSVPFMALTSPSGALLQGVGQERFVAVNSLVCAVLVIGSVAVGAAAEGAVGAATGILLSQVAKSASLALRIWRLS